MRLLPRPRIITKCERRRQARLFHDDDAIMLTTRRIGYGRKNISWVNSQPFIKFVVLVFSLCSLTLPQERHELLQQLAMGLCAAAICVALINILHKEIRIIIYVL